VRGLYKGATPPLVGWIFMDSIMLGSLTVYRRLLAENVFVPSPQQLATTATTTTNNNNNKHEPIAGISPAVAHLPPLGHGLAGVLAGCTVSFVAAPVEHIKARLQIQYAADKAGRLYAGPLDCLGKIYGAHGVRGVYRGLAATLLFRSFFFFWWGAYDVLSRLLRERTALSAPAVNFWAGGLSAQVFWLTSYPSDVVKQRVMTDPLGGGLGDGSPRFRRWIDAARAVYAENGWRGYWRGFVPCFLRAFPANAAALVAFEAVMRNLP
jgi:solute carrier family 25 (mitochondrial carnitine/acylcarnitine transporter), member 20/29